MGACADCGTEHKTYLMFAITPPPGREEGGGRGYFICVPCWDSIMNGAFMSKIRGF